MTLKHAGLAGLGLIVAAAAALAAAWWFSPQRVCTDSTTVATVNKAVLKMSLRTLPEPALQGPAQALISVEDLAYRGHDRSRARTDCSGVVRLREAAPGEPPMVEPFTYNIQSRRGGGKLLSVEIPSDGKFRMLDWAERVRSALGGASAPP
ncbi:MAG TPA: hypothetical protein VM369_11180 [Candidatus Binatia bacterium]|nr:hypothetical protein [Candidatus Binatia bacterium]